MSNDALTQFLFKRAELKRKLAICETSGQTGDCLGPPNMFEIHIKDIKRDIAAYERAITMLIPRLLSA